jgi:PKHD-type hydroxylase
MNFGFHVDNAMRQIPGSGRRIRTDVSATLFLSEPTDYDGGELIVQDTYGTHSAKLPAGDLILYPATSMHRVAPVTRGSRVASFFWIQSMVKDDAERQMLFDLDRSIIEMAQAVPDSPAVLRLTALYHNLVRKWGEPA